MNPAWAGSNPPPLTKDIMAEYTKQKKDQLGKSISAARAILLKQILWRYLDSAGDVLCFRCSERMSSNDFTLDHVEPWWNSSSDLFWDLDNVRFSHHRCNSKHHRPRGKKKDYE